MNDEDKLVAGDRHGCKWHTTLMESHCDVAEGTKREVDLTENG